MPKNKIYFRIMQGYSASPEYSKLEVEVWKSEYGPGSPWRPTRLTWQATRCEPHKGWYAGGVSIDNAHPDDITEQNRLMRRVIGDARLYDQPASVIANLVRIGGLCISYRTGDPEVVDPNPIAEELLQIG